MGLHLLGVAHEQEAGSPPWWADYDAYRADGGDGLGRRGTRRSGLMWPMVRRDAAGEEDVGRKDGGRGNVFEEAQQTMKRTTNGTRDVGKFLRINGSIYDGNDDSRWLALPKGRVTLPLQLRSRPAPGDGFFRIPRAIPRDFSGITQRGSGSYII